MIEVMTAPLHQPTPRDTRNLLWALALANFAVGMGAFVVVGVISPIATGLQLTAAQAGWAMTSYAAVYAVMSPLLVALTGRLDRASVLVAALVVFGAGALIAAWASELWVLLAARALMALGGALITPVAATIGVARSAPDKRGAALATVFGGLTLAQVLGVPVGAWLGYTWGWQAAFVAVAALVALVTAVVAWQVPRGLVVPVASLGALGKVLRQPRLLLAVAYTALFIGALYTLYTFLAPMLEQRLGLSRQGVAGVLLVFGAGAVLGNALGGWLTDHVGSQRTLAALALAQIVLLPVLSWLPVPLWPSVALVGVWSVLSWSFMVAQQARLAQLDAAQMPVLLALNASAIYVGASLGSAAGGAVLSHAGYGPLGLAGALLAALAGLSLTAVARQRD
jgi:MFS transporter, DHA1 family, inner membrane transport protein